MNLYRSKKTLLEIQSLNCQSSFMTVFFLAFPDALPDANLPFSGLGGVGGPAQALPGGFCACAGAEWGQLLALFALFLPCCLSPIPNLHGDGLVSLSLDSAGTHGTDGCCVWWRQKKLSTICKAPLTRSSLKPCSCCCCVQSTFSLSTLPYFPGWN